MKSKLLATLFLLALELVAVQAQIRSQARPDWFDVPLKEQTLDFWPSFDKPSTSSPAWQWKAYRRARNKLTCWWFPTVVVKEYDINEKGAAWTSFIHTAPNVHPDCVPSHSPEEKVFNAGPDWEGYFFGVKEDSVFLTDADGVSGGIRFYVYDSRTGEKVLDDTDCLTCMHLKKMYGREPLAAPFDRMRISKDPSGAITLKYMRVEQADCDLRADEASCWAHVRKKLDVKSAEAPPCFGYDATGYERYKIGELPSMVAHPVLVSLGASPVVKSIDSPVLCWAPE